MNYEALMKNMKARGFLPQLLANGDAAREAALAIIGDRCVGIGGSATVRDIGLCEALQARGNEVHWHWRVPAEEKAAARNAAIASEVYICSSNAILPDGRLVNIDGTGNRVTGTIYGPGIVIIIAGRNKIVDGGLDDAIERIKRETCPKNAQRLGMDTPCARTGKCADCRTAARMCNVVAIQEFPTRVVKEFHILLVDEDLGL